MSTVPGVRHLVAAVKQTPLWKAARAVKRAALPPRLAGPLADANCLAEVEAVDPPPALEAGRDHTWRARLHNRGGAAWVGGGPAPVRLVARWKTFAGDPFGDEAAVTLPRPVYPGEPRDVTIAVPTPAFVGDFVLELDLDQPGGGRFADRHPAGKPATVAVPVVGRRATDIDYHAVYRHADLAANHWWVVGAYHTPEQYERSSRERRTMLEDHADLTPDSRVLDVGCGTGQMGDALDGYLSDRGAYYGTDIGREAVEFCRARFHGRTNFDFRHGEMTRLPFGGGEGGFDLAIFFSVFTHTWADESALLLAETRRLLGPAGKVVCDVITSPLIERCGGHRGEMVVNRDHFLRLAATMGFGHRVIGRWPWNPHAERLMLVLSRV